MERSRTPRGNRCYALIVFLMAIGASAAGAQAQIGATFETIAVLDGNPFAADLVLSGDGETALIRQRDTAAGNLLWTRADGLLRVDELPGVPGLGFDPIDITRDGSRIVGNLEDQAYIWDRGVGATALTALPGGDGLTRVDSISANGQHIVGSSRDGSTIAPAFGFAAPAEVPVIWDGAGLAPTPLGAPIGTAPIAYVSDNGVVAGTLFESIASEQFAITSYRWSMDDEFQRIGNTGSFPSVLGISDDGEEIIQYGRSPIGAESIVRPNEGTVFWSGEPGPLDFVSISGYETLVDVDPLTLRPRERIALSELDATGTRGVGSVRSDAVYWSRDEGLQDLDVLLASVEIDTEGWSFLRGSSISSDGKTILGLGSFSDGDVLTYHAFLATIPEPSTALLLSLGLAGLARKPRVR